MEDSQGSEGSQEEMDGSEGSVSDEEPELHFRSENEFTVKGTRYRVVVNTTECEISSLRIFPCDSDYPPLEARVDEKEPKDLRQSK